MAGPYKPVGVDDDELFPPRVETRLAAQRISDRSRGNHTGTQTASTISDLNESVQDMLNTFLAAGTGVTLSYNDAGNLLTLASTGGGGGLDTEAARDAIGAALLGVGLISVVVNDAADTISILTTATANATDASLRDRTTHTGLQPISSITSLQAAVDKANAAVTPAALTSALATKANLPVGTKNMVALNSTAVGDARPGGTDASYVVNWITTYSTVPTNLLTDVDLWFPPA